MFMTTPDFEQWVPSALAPDGATYWRVMSLVNRVPWYLLTYRHPEGTVETMAVAWETTLKELIEVLGGASVVNLHCIAPSADEAGEWKVKTVSELWLPTEDEARDTGPLLFAVVGEDDLYDSHQSKVTSREGLRKVLLRVGS